MNSTLIISGSSRADGNTAQVVKILTDLTQWHSIDLNDFNIGYYDYRYGNQTDDYIPLMRKIIPAYSNFIFATPVYWYAMSGIMKVFFDRLTDLLDVEKELGRQLRGKQMGVITSSIGNHLGDQFWLPFEHTANYLGMHFLGGKHTLLKNDNTAIIQQFIDLVSAPSSDQKNTGSS